MRLATRRHRRAGTPAWNRFAGGNMSATALLYLHAALVGLVAGGIMVSGYRLVTSRQPSFQTRPRTLSGIALQIVVLTFGGPLVLMRNAIRGRLIEGRPLPFLAASAVIASLWCFFSGVLLLGVLAGPI
jgi:hypothetical protein